ncbi:hypothetical protein B0T24DRAFT_683037 [Lasiosphaeria ovina]|uniref:CID domain-containing protein n=1 Tax=Lasiosphaeria ovina TaxID=92902 RepID=A0AAE0N0T0_9PEZI|nr:hypothetical protein B0T24DRAFT_683037 [Lasiosphaeria ovina]
MASQEAQEAQEVVGKAKVALTSALIRAHAPPARGLAELNEILKFLNATFTQGSPTNIQKCKQWALRVVVNSPELVALFCKYLAALASSFASEKGSGAARVAEPQPQSGRVRQPSAKRRCLSLLYILNDILYHTKVRMSDESFAKNLEGLGPVIPSLFSSTSSFEKCPKHVAKIKALIGLWEQGMYFTDAFVAELRAALDSPLSGQHGLSSEGTAVAKAAKTPNFVFPSTHGDPSTPWFDLPAGNMISLLRQRPNRPMNPSDIKATVLPTSPPPADLVDAVKKLLVDVDKIYETEVNVNETRPDINQMGEEFRIDETTGSTVGDTYYGWSRNFCEQMKARARGDNTPDGEQRGRARSPRSYSRSRSSSQHKLKQALNQTRVQAAAKIAVAVAVAVQDH